MRLDRRRTPRFRIEAFAARVDPTGAGLEYLRGLSNLERLDLNDTQVSDSELAYLRGLTNLRSLWLYDTQVTDEAAKELEHALPNCRISH